MSDQVAQGQATTEINQRLGALLLQDLQPITAKWEEFGEVLGVPYSVVEEIQAESSGRNALTDYCFPKVINAWLKGDQKNLTKEFLVKALEAISQRGLAAEVQKLDLKIDKDRPKSMPILKALKPVKAMYMELGIQLEVDIKVIKGIENYAGNVAKGLNLTIHHWLGMSEMDAPNKKENLLEALEYINHRGLAQQLRRKYKDFRFPGDKDGNDDDEMELDPN